MAKRALFLLNFIFFLSACQQKAKTIGIKPNAATALVVDSCAIAKPFELAKELEATVQPGYTGVVNKYNNVKSGRLNYQHFFENGKIIKSIFYFDNGLVHEEYLYKCGALHGYRKVYYENGKLLQMIPFSYGYLQGDGQLFDEKGNLREALTFVHDSLASKPKVYDEKGQIYEPAVSKE